MASSKDTFLDTDIRVGRRVHLVLTKDSTCAAPEPCEADILKLSNKWLYNFLMFEQNFKLPAGYVFIGRVLDQPRLLCNLKAGAVKLKGCPFNIDILGPADAAAFDQKFGVVANDSPTVSAMDLAELSSDDEFATTPECSPSSSPKSPRTSAQKAKKKAYKQRVKARKRLLSQSSSSSSEDGANPSSMEVLVSLSPRSVLEQCPLPVADVSAQSSLRSELSQPITCSALQPPPLAPEQDTSTKTKARKAKQVKWSPVDFSKVIVEVPAISARTTLIVRPVDPANHLRKLHPIKLSTFLNTTFGEVLEVRDIRCGGLAIDLQPSNVNLEAALATTDILGTKVTVTTPISSSTVSCCSAVVTGVHPELSESELMDQLVSSIPITAVKRLAKPGSQSWVIKVTFSGTEIPDQIRLLGRIHSTKPYKDRPLICLNCSRYGHPARVCRSQTRCRQCSQDHATVNCPQPAKPKCCHCGGPHPADSVLCPAHAFQVKVIEVKQAQGIPFKTARKAVTSAARSYASALKGPAAPASGPPSASASGPLPTTASVPAVTPSVALSTSEPRLNNDELLSILEGVTTILIDCGEKADFQQAVIRVSAYFGALRLRLSQANGVQPAVPPTPTPLT